MLIKGSEYFVELIIRVGEGKILCVSQKIKYIKYINKVHKST
jgi:hypothetical protein